MSPELRQQAEEERLRQAIQLLREEIRIKDARMEQLEAHRRPHYPPTERLAILELRAARGWSLAQTARIFLVSPLTIASWIPLFCSQSRVRISKRHVQFAFRTWQVKAGFDRLYPFHALRHTAVTNVYRASRDLFLAQRFARHLSPLTTTVYTHPSDDELFAGVRKLRC